MEAEFVEDENEGPPKARWTHKTRFPIQDRMAETIRLTIKMTEHSLKKYHRKLRKMQYGS